MPATLQRVEWSLRRLVDPRARPLATTGYLVLGMHRSGTSCLSGLLETSGLWFGEVSRKARFNAKGNRENAAIREASTALLRDAGGGWRRPPAIDFSRVDPRPLRAALEPYRHQPRWAAKDPRMVLTLEAWLPHIPRHRLVGTFRHPYAVARSLHARSEMPVDEGLALWTAYNRRIVDRHRRSPFPILNFDRTGDDYIDRYALACCQLDLPFARGEAMAFYDSALIHQDTVPVESLDGEMAELQAYLVAHQVGGDRPVTASD